MQPDDAPPPHAPQPTGTPAILAETDAWLVVCKPAGWHTVAQQGGSPHTMQAWLAERMPAQAALPECGLAHRLDASTSGCLVVAKTSADYQRLRQAFGAQTSHTAGSWGRRAEDAPVVGKEYLAVAREGLGHDDRFSLYFTSRHKGSSKVTVRDRGTEESLGTCTWKVLGAATAPGHCVARVMLVGPGRRHQIRAGLAHLGAPLLGDALYGGAPHPLGAALHAWRVCVDGQVVEAAPDDRFTPATIRSLPDATSR